MSNYKLEQAVVDVTTKIEEFLDTGKCTFSDVPCADCPADKDPEDVHACYTFMLKSIRDELNNAL